MEAIFNMFKVKFTKLDELLTEHCKDITRDSKVNVFINLESLIKNLACPGVEDYLRLKNNERTFEMISCIINVAAHYRWFFTKNKLYSRVFLYMNYPFKTYQKNRIVNPDYRSYYQEKYTKNPNYFILTDVLNEAIPFTKIILEYIEGVYFIQSEHMESSLIPYVITKESGDNYINLLVTKDNYEYQYVNKDFYIIRPKQDESYIVTKDNLFDHFKKELKVESDLTVDSRYFPFIFSLLGDKNRNIEKIKRIGIANILKTINKALKENIICKDVFNINILSEIIKDEYRPLLLNNFYCVDLDIQQQMLNIKDTYTITSQLVDKFDNEHLKRINDEYFKEYPIYLLEMLEATQLLNKPTKKIIFE